MDRHEHRTIETPRYSRTVLKCKVTVIVTSHRDAHSATLDQFVAEGLGEDKRQLLFAHLARNTAGAWISSAVAGINDDNWAAVRHGRAVDPVRGWRRQVDGEA